MKNHSIYALPTYEDIKYALIKIRRQLDNKYNYTANHFNLKNS